ncbi:helix-turn-helix domain-containing protein [Streptomyces sp. NPDC095602]|uniref:helix-turn-helix domain-containing protein n=1 Tax=Streptomyces sp. NPDC095602 TaxID=3155819 RepID=UPI003330A0AD
MTPDVPLYRLVSADLLRLLMDRTGTGRPVSVRQLAALTGVPRTTIGDLMTGTRSSAPAAAAHAIASVLGVDVLVLWVPEERAAKARAGTAVP